MNELQRLVKRLKKHCPQYATKDLGGSCGNITLHPNEICEVIPLLEAHLQANELYTHEQKVAMVRNREASVFHDDREAIEKAMKVCFPNDNDVNSSYCYDDMDAKFYYAFQDSFMDFTFSTFNHTPKSFLASKFFENSRD